MGKGFNNYMCKKFFHPASRDNLKRVWMAEQKADSYKKKQEELRVQYEKEQDLYTNKALLSKESKDKLSVNFMYEPPPGTKKEREREDDEPEYKFEWQRKFNAPREDYCKGDSEIRDQPFGIQVRNVRCIKCHKWGHINTDKECPMYNQSSSAENTASSLDTHLLLQQMREDGLAMKKSALSLQQQTSQRSVKVESDDDKLKASDIEMLKSLSKKQKKKLLRALLKLEKMENGHSKEKRKKHKNHSKHKKEDNTDSSNSDGEQKHKNKKKKSKKTSSKKHTDKDKKKQKKKQHNHNEQSSSSTSSSSSSSEDSSSESEAEENSKGKSKSKHYHENRKSEDKRHPTYNDEQSDSKSRKRKSIENHEGSSEKRQRRS
ncbi:corepressor interacting with RBPJ 1 [Schistocerca nitens]|uniref:corepressor interacting with RBPJ 1 n=1 Tax=Schistocerca nitens TaxID=7011 RepID=UPI0021191B21|nr:corepressor interacting with RBPJ 1 [Schistocerca nitens]